LANRSSEPSVGLVWSLCRMKLFIVQSSYIAWTTLHILVPTDWPLD
jgi:hypothetical protein